ncbi:MAG TPA: hypothetical protein VNK95_02165 [Caldilineaceae bacterium]|nr:hypothetical protein [Caldilineaceae bacterium]
MIVELRVLAALAAVLLLPGGALVALTGAARRWSPLSRLALAVALSIAFFPVLFTLTPGIRWGPAAIALLLAAAALAILWRLSVSRPRFAAPDLLGWAAGFTLLLALAVRWWMAYQHPYPAWTDSLHHTLLTQLTMEQGRLPATLEPYFPIPLTMYHLGLYSLAAPVGWLAGVAPHTALLWTAQTLNGLNALGVYLALARRPGGNLSGDSARLAGLVGAAVVGLWSFQPAFYVNWGRFTQVASQALLPAAWLLTCQAVALLAAAPSPRPAAQRASTPALVPATGNAGPAAAWIESSPASPERTAVRASWGTLWLTVAGAALLSAGVFLLHFRVAIFYLLWVGIGVGQMLGWRPGWAKLGRAAVALVAIGLLALVLLAPVAGAAVGEYLRSRIAQSMTGVIDPAQSAAIRQGYFIFPWESIFTLGLRPWLLALALAAAIFGCLRRNGMVIGALLWSGLLFALGHTYLLRISLLNVTNLGAVLILLYLPAALILGAAAAELAALAPGRWAAPARRALAVVTAAAALAFAPVRVQDVEPYRYFVTPDDLAALAWIRDHTPPGARFAVNTVFWLPEMPHGADAGYWIPYFTGRQMTAGVMLLNLAAPAYREEVVALSKAAAALAESGSDPARAGAAVAALRELGVAYVYAGARGNFAGPAFDPDRLAATPGVKIVFRRGRAAVAQLLPDE